MRIFRAIVFLCSFAASASAAEVPVEAIIPFVSEPGTINNKDWTISDGWANGDIQSCEWQKDAVSLNGTNIMLTLSDKGGKVRPYACGEIHTNTRTGYGMYEARIKTAKGSGLNTAFFTYIGSAEGSSGHDEIDFEFLGKDPTSVQVNFYIDGKNTGGQTIKLGFDTSKDFHTYAFVWQQTRILWFVDRKLVHQTSSDDHIPSTPGRIYLSLWSGSKIYNDWLGPFKYKEPVSAEYAWVKYAPLNVDDVH